jgi:hypothetical protein
MVVSTGTRPAQIAINRQIEGLRPPVQPNRCLAGGGLALSKIKARGFGASIEPKTRKEKSCSGRPPEGPGKFDPGQGGETLTPRSSGFQDGDRRLC